MPCVTLNCKNPVLPESTTWGFDVEICSICFDARLGLISENVPGRREELLRNTYLQDFAKISLMLEKGFPKVQQCLQKLGGTWDKTNEQLNEQKGIEDSNDYVKLSSTLAKYERICWFPASHDIFLGFLKTVDFDGAIARGIMAKDPGASVNHGDFTHRLQWHVIMRVITMDFKVPKRDGWNHSPLDLYTTCGKTPYDGVNNIWFRLFDNALVNDFRSPDWTNRHVCSGNYGSLSVAAAKRHLKRLMEYLKHDVAPVLESSSSLNVRKSKNYKEAFQNFRNEYAERKTKNSKGRSIDGVIMSSPWSGKGGANIDSMTIEARITASYGPLNELQNKADPVLGVIRTAGKDDAVSVFHL